MEKLHADMKIPKHDMLQQQQQQQYQHQQPQQQEPLQLQPHLQQPITQASATDIVSASRHTALMEHSALMPAIGAPPASKTGK